MQPLLMRSAPAYLSQVPELTRTALRSPITGMTPIAVQQTASPRPMTPHFEPSPASSSMDVNYNMDNSNHTTASGPVAGHYAYTSSPQPYMTGMQMTSPTLMTDGNAHSQLPFLYSAQSVPASFGIPPYYSQQSYQGLDVTSTNAVNGDFALRSTLSLPISPAMQTTPITSPLMLRGITSPIPSPHFANASLTSTRNKTIAKHSNATSTTRAYSCEFDNCSRTYSTPQARRQHYRRRHQEAWATRKRKVGRQQSVEYVSQSSHEGDSQWSPKATGEHRTSTDSGAFNPTSSPTLTLVAEPPIITPRESGDEMTYSDEDHKFFPVESTPTAHTLSDNELMQILMERIDSQRAQQQQLQTNDNMTYEEIMSGSAYDDIQNIEQFIRC